MKTFTIDDVRGALRHVAEVDPNGRSNVCMYTDALGAPLCVAGRIFEHLGVELPAPEAPENDASLKAVRTNMRGWFAARGAEFDDAAWELLGDAQYQHDLQFKTFGQIAEALLEPVNA